MKNLYLVLAILGFLFPSYFVLLESWETGNILLYTNPMATLQGMFATRISSIFMIDLLFAVLVFFLWSYEESKKHNITGLYGVWALTMLFGLASGLPLFLYLRAKQLKS